MNYIAPRWLIGLLVVGLIACGSNSAVLEQPAASPTQAPLTRTGVTITVAARSGAIAKALNSIIPEWEELTGNQVELLEFPYAYLQEKVFTDVQTGQGQYDVVLLDDPWLPAMAGNGYLVPLAQFGYEEDPDFIGRSLDVSRWPPPYGPQPPNTSPEERPQLYALPLIGNVQLFWYRRDLVTREPTSITDLMQLVQTVSSPAKGLDGYAYRGSWGNPIVTEFNAWNWSYGGDIFDENWNVIIHQEKSVHALTDFISFTQEVSSKQASYNSTREVANALLSGSAVSAIVWPTENSLIQTAENPSIASQIQIIPFPAAERQTSQLGNWLLAVPATAVHKQIAFDFILWATSQDTMIQLAYQGMPPTRHSVFADPTLTNQFWWFPATEDALAHATWRPRTPEWNKIEHILGNYLARALSSELSPQEALDQAAEDITRLMEKAGY